MANWFVQTLRSYPEIAILLSLAFGYYFGSFTYKGLGLGAVTATLIAAVIIGQLNIPVPGPLKPFFFLMFLFAIGYAVGPQFVRGIASDGLPQAIYAALVCVFCLLGAYLAGIRVMLAPLRFGAGVKGKVLISLGQGLPCVMSEVAAEGLGLPGALRTLLVAEDDEAFQRKALRFHADGALWQRASELALRWAQETLSAAAIDAGLAAALEAPLKPEARQLSA